MRRPKSWSAVCHQYLPSAEHLLPRVDRARRGPRRPFGGPQAEAPAAAQVGEAVGEGVKALQAKAIRVEKKIGGAAAPFANDRLGRFHRRFCRSNDVRVAGLDLGPVGCPLRCLARDESIAPLRSRRTPANAAL